LNSASIRCTDGAIELQGTIDHGSILELIEPGERCIKQSSSDTISVDWGKVNLANSAALALLLHWRRQAEAIDKSLINHHVPEFLISLARISQLDFLFATDTTE
jgi:ABC-type transporter Mla MlaB component